MNLGFAVARFVGCACALSSAIYSADWMTYVLYAVCLASLLKFFFSMYRSEFLDMGIELVCGGSLALNMMHPGAWVFGLVVAWAVLTLRALLDLIKEFSVALTLVFNKEQTRNGAVAISDGSSEEASSHEEAELQETSVKQTHHYVCLVLLMATLNSIGIWMWLTVIEHFLFNSQSHIWVIKVVAVLGVMEFFLKLFKKNWSNLICTTQGILVAASFYINIGELKWVIIIGAAAALARFIMMLVKLVSACLATLLYGKAAIVLFMDVKSHRRFFSI